MCWEFSNINSELICSDLVLEKSFQHLDQPLIFYKAVPIHVTSNSIPCSLLPKEDEGNQEEDKGELDENEVVLEDCQSYLELSDCFLACFATFANCYPATRFVHVCACYSNISQSQYLSDSYLIQHIQRDGDNSTVVTNQEWLLIESIQ